MDLKTNAIINHALAEAKRQHPEFADSLGSGMNNVAEEYLETVTALNDGDIPGMVLEASHTIATLIRLISMAIEQHAIAVALDGTILEAQTTKERAL